MAKDVFSKSVPHSLEAEASVLGCMLLDNKTIDIAMEALSSEDFYSQQNRWVFECMRSMASKGIAIDTLTLSDELKKIDVFDKIGGHAYLASIGDSVLSTANIEPYCHIVKEKSIKRYLISSLDEILNKCYQDLENSAEILEAAQKIVYDLSLNRTKKDFITLAQSAEKAIIELTEAYKNPSKITGISTGFEDLDAKTAGLQKGDLILIAARPSMGKTALAVNIAQNAALNEGKNVAIFSLEMSAEQLTTRIISSQSEVDSGKIKRGKQSTGEWSRIISTFMDIKKKGARVFLDDTSGITPGELRNKCRKLKSLNGLDLIVVDYLQLMSPGKSSESRQQEISSISRELKGIAKEINCPMIAVSQLSRAPEARTSKRPMLSDLRESGAIEQDADLVCMIYRDRYYNPESEDDSTELIITKNRNGEVGTIKLSFIGQYTKFVPYVESIPREEE